jgi:hypothetical protein
MKTSELDAQALVTLDAFEAGDPRALKLLAPILKVVRGHGFREGQAACEWAASFIDVTDEAYINSSKISAAIGIPTRLWPHVKDAWAAAFKRGLAAVYAERFAAVLSRRRR